MEFDLDKRLSETYPLILSQKYKGTPADPFYFGFECGPGWFNIIDRLCRNIQNHIDQRAEDHNRAVAHNKMRDEMLAGDFTEFENRFVKLSHGDTDWVERNRAEILAKPWPVPELVEQVVAAQVKEKFGTLRFYYDGGDEYVSGMVRMAEAMSGCTCEQCGAPGKSYNTGWMQTMCEAHAPKEEE